MYNNPYYNPQSSIDRINNQIAELERLKAQIPQQQVQPSINQTFQLAPNNREVIRYANSMEEVKKDVIIGDTPYFSKDMSIVWVKHINGDIKTYELNEIISKDDKDLRIEYLEAQLIELKKGLKDERNTNANESITKSSESQESADVSTISKSTKKSKQS